MATRATYQINATTFYCHWDGYPTGAAQRFASMVAAMTVCEPERPCEIMQDRRGGFEYAFIRGNLDAEATDSHGGHGDTVYRYTLTVEGGGFAKITVDEREWTIESDAWKQNYFGDLADWLNEQRGALVKQTLELAKRYPKEYAHVTAETAQQEALEAIPVIVRAIETRDPGFGKSAFAIYATLSEAEKITAHARARSESFQADNPNRLEYARKAETWHRATQEIGQAA